MTTINNIMSVCKELNDEGLYIAYNAVLSIRDKKKYNKPQKQQVTDIDAKMDRAILLAGGVI